MNLQASSGMTLHIRLKDATKDATKGATKEATKEATKGATKCRRCQHHVDPIALYSFAVQRGKFFFKKPSIYFIREYIKGLF